MHPNEELLNLAYAKLSQAEAFLELVCRRHEDCSTCPLNTRVGLEGKPMLPGNGDERCLYHILSSDGIGWNYGFRACHTCFHFHEGGCTLDKREGLVDECVACEDYEEDTNDDNAQNPR